MGLFSKSKKSYQLDKGCFDILDIPDYNKEETDKNTLLLKHAIDYLSRHGGMDFPVKNDISSLAYVRCIERIRILFDERLIIDLKDLDENKRREIVIQTLQNNTLKHIDSWSPTNIFILHYYICPKCGSNMYAHLPIMVGEGASFDCPQCKKRNIPSHFICNTYDEKVTDRWVAGGDNSTTHFPIYDDYSNDNADIIEKYAFLKFLKMSGREEETIIFVYNDLFFLLSKTYGTRYRITDLYRVKSIIY